MHELQSSHGGEPGGPQQHAGDDHRLSTKAVGDSTAEDPQPLLDKLAQAKSNPHHQGGPTELIHKANRNKREDNKKTEHNQHIIDEQEIFTQAPGLRYAGHLPSRECQNSYPAILRGC